MKYFVTRNNSTSESTELDLNLQYDHLATVIIDSDENGNGRGEYRFISADNLRQPKEHGGWRLGSSVLMKYGWGSSTLILSITDKHGKTHEITIELNLGCRSSYWGVSSIQAILTKFKTISVCKDWKDYEIVEYKSILKTQINSLLLQKEEMDNRISLLKAELEAII